MNRVYGTGSISQRKNGRLEVRLRVMENGRPKQKSLGYAKTRKEAQRLLDEGRKRYYLPDGEKRAHGERHTVKSWLDWWLENVVKLGDAGTYADYRQLMFHNVIPVIGHKWLDGLTGADDKDIQTRARAKGLKPSTIRHLRTIFGGALQYAVGEMEFPDVKNIVRDRKPLYPVLPTKREIVSAEAGLHLLNAVSGSRYRHAYALMFLCGLRINEALGVGWDDVDFGHRALHVEHQLKLRRGSGGQRYLAAPKKDSRRTVDLPEPAIAALQAQETAQKAERTAAMKEGIPWLNSDGLVFTGPYGAPASDSTVRKEFRQLQAAAGLPYVKPHGLRHSFTSVLWDMNVPLPVIAAALGHKDPSVTLRVYSHMLTDQRGVAGDAMTRAFAAT